MTHPDCTRYFMTIREAVGLVLLAGLALRGASSASSTWASRCGSLELARNLITMAGRVPGRGDPDHLHGAPPRREAVRGAPQRGGGGDRAGRDGIRVARGAPPPPRFRARSPCSGASPTRGTGRRCSPPSRSSSRAARLAGAPRRHEGPRPRGRAGMARRRARRRGGAARGRRGRRRGGRDMRQRRSLRSLEPRGGADRRLVASDAQHAPAPAPAGRAHHPRARARGSSEHAGSSRA